MGRLMKSTSIGADYIVKMCTPTKAITPRQGNEQANEIVRLLLRRAYIVYNAGIVPESESVWDLVDIVKRKDLLKELDMSEDELIEQLSYGNDDMLPGEHALTNLLRLCHAVGIKVTFEQMTWKEHYGDKVIYINDN